MKETAHEITSFGFKAYLDERRALRARAGNDIALLAEAQENPSLIFDLVVRAIHDIETVKKSGKRMANWQRGLLADATIRLEQAVFTGEMLVTLLEKENPDGSANDSGGSTAD